MIFDENKQEIDYYENWPEHFYEVPDVNQRREMLLQASSKGIIDNMLDYRKRILDKRFQPQKNKNSLDTFTRAWMMIYSSHSSGINFFNKKRLKKELLQYAEDLMLTDYRNGTLDERECIEAEWQNYALTFLTNCSSSKAYCSTLFSIVPISDKNVALKMAGEIKNVTLNYPKQFEMDALFAPFHNVMKNTYISRIKDGHTYWNSPEN